MIIQLLLTPIYLLISGFISLLPNGYDLPNWISKTIVLISKGLWFFPEDMFSVIVANVSFWLLAQFAWSIIEWVYKKLPGIS